MALHASLPIDDNRGLDGAGPWAGGSIEAIDPVEMDEMRGLSQRVIPVPTTPILLISTLHLRSTKTYISCLLGDAEIPLRTGAPEMGPGGAILRDRSVVWAYAQI